LLHTIAAPLHTIAAPLAHHTIALFLISSGFLFIDYTHEPISIQRQ
jgi:hypothetical protein